MVNKLLGPLTDADPLGVGAPRLPPTNATRVAERKWVPASLFFGRVGGSESDSDRTGSAQTPALHHTKSAALFGLMRLTPQAEALALL